MNPERWPDPLVIRAIPAWSLVGPAGGSVPRKRVEWEVLQPFRYVSPNYGTIEVPAGLITDFASIPQAVRWAIDDDSWNVLFPSIVHDYLYGGRIGTRERADDIMLEAMESVGASWLTRHTVYRAVRMFGGRVWRT